MYYFTDDLKDGFTYTPVDIFLALLWLKKESDANRHNYQKKYSIFSSRSKCPDVPPSLM